MLKVFLACAVCAVGLSTESVGKRTATGCAPGFTMGFSDAVTFPEHVGRRTVSGFSMGLTPGFMMGFAGFHQRISSTRSPMAC